MLEKEDSVQNTVEWKGIKAESNRELVGIRQ